MGQLLRFSLTVPERPYKMDVYEYMVTLFVDEVRQCLKDGGYAAKENEEESGGTFLVGYQGRLFVIHGDYQVGENVDSYNSVGCGEEYALGSMYSTEKLIKGPKDRIIKALKTAEKFSGGVRGPFTIEVL